MPQNFVPPNNHWFSNWMTRLDGAIEEFDFNFNRTQGGGLTLLNHRIEPFNGHSIVGCLLFPVLLVFLTFGPSFRVHQISAYLALVGVLTVHLVLAWLAGRRLKLFHVQVVTVASMYFFLYLIPVLGDAVAVVLDETNGKEVSGGLYPHLLLPLVAALGVVAAVARRGARFLLFKFRNRFPEGAKPDQLLERTNLFRKDDDDSVSQLRPTALVLGLATTPLRHPIEMLLPPSAFLVIFGSGAESDLWWAGGLLALAWLLLTLGDIDDQLSSGQLLLKRMLSYGGQWVTSLSVVGLAAAWLTDFGYVRTVMEGDRSLIVQYIATAYLVFWWLEYWFNRAISEELLKQLVAPPQHLMTAEQIRYTQPPANEGEPITTEAAEPDATGAGYLQIHGAGRFAVIRPERPGERSWKLLDRTGLFESLARSATGESAPRVRLIVRRLERRLQAYFALLNLGVLLVIGSLVAYVESRDKQPVIVAEDDPLAGKVVLADLLFHTPPARATQAPPKRPRVILVAASGGGTRAALFATSVLNGLARVNAIEDVRLLSGVSGGGLSVAWFAAHRQRLIAKDFQERERAWRDFQKAMQTPFIVDVLHGGSESRIAEGIPLSQLLAESFARQFRDQEAWRLNGVSSELGLILNSTLCGTFPPDFGTQQKSGSALRFSEDHASARHSGGRLIFTNLKCRDAFPLHRAEDNTWSLPHYVVIDDPSVRLASAAACNANFPPVFPNAAVDVSDPQGRVKRYWVTDGGAEENQGLISVLTVLHHAVESLAEAKPSSERPVVFPDIHLVVAEASADSVYYSGDRGVGAIGMASKNLSYGYSAALLNDLRLHYRNAQGNQTQNPATIELHVLAMPSCLRYGGIGTHWMLPNTVRLKRTDVRAANSEITVELPREAVATIIQDLHLPENQEPRSPTDSTRSGYQHVWDWIRTDPLSDHPQVWSNLRKKLAE